jgi:hypothetical protein
MPCAGLVIWCARSRTRACISSLATGVIVALGFWYLRCRAASGWLLVLAIGSGVAGRSDEYRAGNAGRRRPPRTASAGGPGQGRGGGRCFVERARGWRSSACGSLFRGYNVGSVSSGSLSESGSESTPRPDSDPDRDLPSRKNPPPAHPAPPIALRARNIQRAPRPGGLGRLPFTAPISTFLGVCTASTNSETVTR